MKKFVFCILILALWKGLSAQIPVEIFGGDKKASFDVMFFKFFRNKEGQNSKFLFFSRERAVADYKQTASSNLPQSGFTEAISYNHPTLRGFAPVIVGQILNRGTFAKTGIQYAHISKTLTVFGYPFENRITDVPMTAMCTTIERDLKEMLGERDLPEKHAAKDGFLF